ncbi:TPA: phage tail protein [Vibrio cholerae]
MSIPESALNYGSILTLAGENAEINGKLNSKSINFTHIAIGDANDVYVQPSRTQTALVHELARIPITGMEKITPSKPDAVPQLKVWAKIPDDIVDIAVREFAAVATFDGTSYLHAIGNTVRIPILSGSNNGGEVNDIYIEMTFAVTSLDPIVIIDPTIVTATRKFVKDEDAKHLAATNPHPQYLSLTRYEKDALSFKQEWSALVNYGIGHEVVRNGLRYIARVASGPDNGGVIDPSADSDWSHWKPIWALNQVENLLKGNQNWNVPGRTGHPLPDATPRNYPSGAEIVLGVFVGQGSTLDGVTLVEGVLSAVGGNYTITRRRFGTGLFAGVKLENGTIVRANSSISETGVMLSYPSESELRITVSIDMLKSKIGVNRGAHKFAGISELPGVWSDVSDEESANAVLYNKEYASVPIGVPFPHFGELPPMNDPRFRYVVLTDADPYNNGILSDKEVSGAAPNLVIKYKVSMQNSPLNGTKIEMLNTMEASLNPSETKSKVFNDTIRNITAGFSVVDSNNQVGALENGSGAISLSTTTGKIPSWFSGSQAGTRYTTATFNASNVVPTGNRNQTFAIGAVYIMRIK